MAESFFTMAVLVAVLSLIDAMTPEVPWGVTKLPAVVRQWLKRKE